MSRFHSRPTHPAPMSTMAPTRRDFLRVGSLALAGVTLPQLFEAEAKAASATRRRPAKSCILFFLEGGPSHIDLWDMKPDAPEDVRGEFRAIHSSATGVHVCEHLPMLARQMHHVAVVRSVHHTIVDHNAGAYYALTGQSPINGNQLVITPSADDFPPYGAVVKKLLPTGRSFPSFVQLPDIMSNNGSNLPGQHAGFMGPSYNPFVMGDPSVPDFRVEQLELPDDLFSERVSRRFDLLRALESHRQSSVPQAEAVRKYQEQALDLLVSDDARVAFDLRNESPRTRERYGMPDRTDRSVQARSFGGLPHTGQCMLMARRLIEAGTRLVTVASGRRLDQAWDTHRDHFPLLKQSLLPYTDRGFSALLEDLHLRGLLEETLVVAMGEFGRTPRLGQITSDAAADANGRDHWPHCYSVLFAGGGIQGGAVYGSSDKHGAYPATDPVTPEDIAATIYYALGIDPHTEIIDRLSRPRPLSEGQPITQLFT